MLTQTTKVFTSEPKNKSNRNNSEVLKVESDGFVGSSGRMSDMMWATLQHGQVHNPAVAPAGLT